MHVVSLGNDAKVDKILEDDSRKTKKYQEQRVRQDSNLILFICFHVDINKMKTLFL